MKNTFISWLWFLLIAVVFILVGCSSPNERRIKKLNQISNKVEQKGDRFSKDDWEKAIEQYETLLDQLNKSSQELTSEQHKEIGRISAKMLKLTVKYYVGSTTNAAKNELSGFLEELEDTSAWEDELDELEGLMEEFEGLFGN